VPALNGFPRGKNLTHVKSSNLSAVLEAIIRLGPISRIEISSLTGLTSSTITNLVNELLYHGLVCESGSAASQGGRRRTLLSLNVDACWLGAIAVQESRIQGALLNLAAETRWHVEDSYTDAAVACEQLGERLLGLAATQGQPVVGFGIGSSPHVALPPTVMHKLQLPVTTDTDVRVSALGEAWFGVGSEVRSLAYVSADQPMAVGMVMDRQLYRGAHGIAGLLPCAACTDLQTMVEQGQQGHPTVQEGLRSLAVVVALTMGLYDPQAVVVGGSLAEWFPGLPAALMNCDILRELGVSRQQPVLLTSKLGREATVVGAACLVLQEFVAHPIEFLSSARAIAQAAAGG
jgi:predicted NBD/HSP70 family sugar kinase